MSEWKFPSQNFATNLSQTFKWSIFQVLVGETKKVKSKKRYLKNVASVEIHPSYQLFDNSMQNDIGIAILEQKLEFNKKIQPLALPILSDLKLQTGSFIATV